MATSFDLVLRGGRVIDPETNLDGVRDVGIRGRQVVDVSAEPLDGSTVVDVSGLVVAPGFIDLHSHAQTLAGRRLQACDGVTTALDLEAGRLPIDAAYEREERHGSPIHYGFSASWAAARMKTLAGIEPDGGFGSALTNLGNPEWQKEAAPSDVASILEQVHSGIAAGGLGVGLLMGYAPGVDPAEYTQVALLAAEAGVPTFTHCRDLVEFSPKTRIDGSEEVVRAAAETGAHMHHCHINSTSGRHIDRVLSLVARCQSEGSKITTEAYPYGSGATGITATFLSPERLAERGLKPTSITYLPTGERIADMDRLRELRTTDPGATVIVDILDENDPKQFALLRRSLLFPDSIVASDAMPPVPQGGARSDQTTWPVAPTQVTHPRTAGTYARALRLWRQEGTPLLEAVSRCTLLPARVLEDCAPAFRTKGRVGIGADADLVVFDADRVTDEATYSEGTRPSSGITHVLVSGTFVVRDGALVLDALPGQPLRSHPR